ncbi:hypothetical protein BU25DRAFT_116677 [Macroventuria anomochaeta]|uniref:Uncharacterized protein n=1 Tax=Macroventuria anomochaeta TaxID=301207 RepID=A0ACB6RV06_9PLEO|nr:uncharacterized protein BU25DRAFT_116677 [Macroventuria anomochaeta]KAF2625609.1 hypothetical protein BU25DRAFT_116677 [Macroventuria anomochaeta]
MKSGSTGAVPAVAFLCLTGTLSARPCPRCGDDIDRQGLAVDIGFPPVVFPLGQYTLADCAAETPKFWKKKQTNIPLSEPQNTQTLGAPICPVSHDLSPFSRTLWHLTLVTLASLTINL